MKTTLLVLSLNEIEGMKWMMNQIQEDWCDQILVVDGGSTDGTIEYARSQGYEVLVQVKPGLMNAYREAYPQIRGDIVIPFSPDGNSPAAAIPQLIDKMQEGYDMVIASRYLPGAYSEDDTPITALGNWVFTKLINLFSSVVTIRMPWSCTEPSGPRCIESWDCWLIVIWKENCPIRSA